MKRHTIPVTAAILALLIAISPAMRAAEQSASQTPAPTPAAKVVNINTATAAELETLPGVGPALSARIIEYRQKNNGFKKVEELMNVKGIGEKSFLKLKALVSIAPPKTIDK